MKRNIFINILLLLLRAFAVLFRDHEMKKYVFVRGKMFRHTGDASRERFRQSFIEMRKADSRRMTMDVFSSLLPQTMTDDA